MESINLFFITNVISFSLDLFIQYKNEIQTDKNRNEIGK